ncbi:peptide/nickel transport system substrate-binding protein [Cricetibacter osteomyelitidis]|uniref:Peptide/nickel transport system substrate-binding protein n=1 Tax=Cricetibacter osteomyelitidis TaxID=1521931 RepID=A0A4R2T1T2_9PAST|nr:ABC transporter substrate-binding protein [Cricetibacter osteomyelitidis]TCP95321.1 peptide/nickel transport system substrate-binding protein [Cricetibacter osteomyelitidis]
MKKAFSGFVLGILGLLLAACDSNDSVQNISTNPSANHQTLTVVTPWEITSADPSKSGYIFQRLQLAETLVDSDSSGKIIPALAESWSHNAQLDTWTFVLRNVKFHDNSSLTAEDVVKSLQVALSKPTVLKSAFIKNITALDVQTVQFQLEKPLAFFPAYLTHATAIILAKSSFDEQNNVVKLVGTGPYQVVKLEPPQKIEQTAFSDYWGDKAKIANITYLANSRSETRALLAQSNQDHLVFNLDAASLARLQQDSNLNVQSKSIARTIQFKVNVANPLFSDINVRQALSDAIDRKGIAESVLRINNGAAEQLFPAIFADWRLNVTVAQKPDYAEIKNRLINLGFTADEKGMLSKDGMPFKFTLRTFSDRPELPIIATALQNQWKQIGVDVAVSVGNFSEIPAGHQDGTLEMALYARNYGMIPTPIGVLMTDFASEGNDWGVMNWHNDKLTAALNELQSTADNEHQFALKQKISGIIYTEKPITPVVFYQQNVVAHNSLKGLELDAFERTFNLNKLSW